MRLMYTAAAVLLSFPAYADDAATPTQAAVVVQKYDDSRPVALTVQVGRVTNIQISETETVKRFIFGQSAPVSSLKKTDENQAPMLNNVPVFGDKAGYTNAILVTNDIAHGGRERTYLFDIHVVAPGNDGTLAPGVVEWLKFTYPEDLKQAQAQQTKLSWKEQQEQKQEAIARARMNVDVFYGTKHLWAYKLHGTARSIAPIEIMDNTSLTAFRYPGNMVLPSIFKVNDGEQGRPVVCTGGKPSRAVLEAPEETVNVRMLDDMIVVQQTAQHWRLRSGDQVLDVFNCAYDPIGYNPGTGTTSPDVFRRVIVQKEAQR